MQIAIHQPNYLPWLGYFAKMHLANKFLFLDTVQFSKGSYTNRCQVFNSDSGQKHWLTIPLIHDSESDKSILSIRVNESIDWRSDHLRKIAEYYHNAPFESEGLELVTTAIKATSGFNDLSTINRTIIKSICDSLDLNVNFETAAHFENMSNATDLLIHIVKSNGGDSYISGSGGRKYLDEQLFQENEIQLVYSDFSDWLKQSTFSESMSTINNGCSIVDAIMNYGLEATSSLIRLYKKEILF